MTKNQFGMDDVREYLGKIKTLDEATIEDMAKEIRTTSSCIVVDREDMKSSLFQFSILGTRKSFFIGVETADLEYIQVEIPFKRFISGNFSDNCLYAEKQLISNARALAAMLLKAADKMKHEI